MPLHLQEFSREAFQGYIENVPPARERILARFMPAKPIFDIKFSYNVLNGKYARTASITGFNAGAPLRSKAGLEKHFGQVAKVQHGFRLDEEELLQYNNAKTDPEAQQVVDAIYDETDDLVEGIRDIEEWFRAQAIYNGRVQYSENDVEIDVAFDVPAPINVATPFSDYANAEPLTVLQSAVETYKGNNKQRKPAEMHMSETVLNDLVASEQVKNHIYGSPTDARMVTRDQLQALLTSLGLPRFVVNDDMVNHVNGEERLLPERRIVLMPSDSLGELMQGITVENGFKPGMYVLPEIQETNPPMQAVYVGETVFPAFKRPKAVQFLNV